MLCSVADKMKQKNRSISTSRLTASSCPNEIARSRRRIVPNAWSLLTCYPKTKVPPGKLKVSWLFRHFRTVMFALLPVYICVFLNFLSSFFGWNCWALSPASSSSGTNTSKTSQEDPIPAKPVAALSAAESHSRPAVSP